MSTRQSTSPEDQISEAVAAEDWSRAADLLKLHGERILLDGGVPELTSWLGALPPEYVSRHVKVAALEAWVHIYEQRYREAMTALAQAERALQQQRISGADSDDDKEGEGAVVLQPFAEQEQSLGAIRLHLRAVTEERVDLPAQVEDIMLPASNDHPLWRAGALVILGRSRYLAGNLKGATDDLEAAHTLATSTNISRGVKVAADANLLLGRVAVARGELGKAVKRYEELLDKADTLESARIAAQVGLARVAIERLDAETAAKHLGEIQIDEAARTSKVDPVRVVIEGDVAQAWCHLLNNRVAEAHAALDQLEKTLISLMLRWPLDLVAATRARFALLKGNKPKARRWLQQHMMQRDTKRTPNSPITAMAAVTAALVHNRLGEADAAIETAESALEFADAQELGTISVLAKIALAQARRALGDKDGAKKALTEALEATRKMDGALLSLFVNGVDTLADELGLKSKEIERVAELLAGLSDAQLKAAAAEAAE